MNPPPKRLRISSPKPSIKDTIGGESTRIDVSEEDIDPLEYWRTEFYWPKKYFERESHMNPLARKKSSSFRSEQWEAGYTTPTSITPSDQKPREVKSAPYTDPSYTIVLATKGSFMDTSDLDITNTSKNLCRILLETEQTVPKNSLFRDEIFDRVCEKIQDKNKARVIQDIDQLIVPSAENLATYNTTHLNHLIENVNEDWNNAIPFHNPRPQPDYSVEFERSAFTNDQLQKLIPFVGELTNELTSYFIIT
ncbi:6b17ecd2-9bb7-4d93-9ed9-96f8293340b6 [Sclerotinia trifoliorum]|uniref:6b17ecd2-9bb7-4d93-9ed9-96f8293340b6 n=1 Tax=Sclerotinia trifoliorum TaxID=28548 RepID=A0A8H2ZRD8_9HELO|nr:6b17ecd2-9bb7-4d93-9ed9-96f8293340b6 [Sclerotinia trifoliorum]